ncbi:MAG: TolC family protein, partial [Armatimonadota bacterium]
VEQLREVALRQRPEVVQAEAKKRMAEAGLEIARIQRNPRLVTSAGLNATPEDPAQRADWQLSMSVTMPLWDAGQSRARVLEAEAELQSAEAELEQLKKDVGAEVEEAYLNVTNARERLVASRLAADAARVNLEATTARYQQGVAGVSVVNLILAQVEYSTASTNAIQALYDVYLAQAQLERALGRFPSFGK